MSEWKRSAAARRDERNAKDEPKPGRKRRSGRGKWCRGKKGVEHVLVCIDYSLKGRNITRAGLQIYQGWKVLACSVCGKELEYYYPNRDKEPPPWVV